MYFVTLPEKTKELKDLARRLDERYPGVHVEFGIEDELIVTGVWILNGRLIFCYTTSEARRNGHMTEHIEALINDGRVTSACCSPVNFKAMAMLAKCGFSPVGFYHPLDDGTKEDKPYVNYRLNLDAKEVRFGDTLNEVAKSWVEDGMVVEGLPIKL